MWSAILSSLRPAVLLQYFYNACALLPHSLSVSTRYHWCRNRQRSATDRAKRRRSGTGRAKGDAQGRGDQKSDAQVRGEQKGEHQVAQKLIKRGPICLAQPFGSARCSNKQGCGSRAGPGRPPPSTSVICNAWRTMDADFPSWTTLKSWIHMGHKAGRTKTNVVGAQGGDKDGHTKLQNLSLEGLDTLNTTMRENRPRTSPRFHMAAD